MENNSVTTGRKTKRIVILAAAVILVCAAIVGGVFAWNALSGKGDPAVVDKPPVDNNPVADKKEPGNIVLDDEGRPEDGSDITQTETAVDSDKLRELLLADGKFAIELTEDVRIDQELTVNGTKKLMGNKSIIMELYADPFQSVLKVPAGATLILDGVTLDGNGIANGVTVEKGGGLTGLAGKILYPVPYGILNAGTVQIKDIDIDSSVDTGLCVQDSGRAFVDGSTIQNCAQRGIYIVAGGYVSISDVLVQNNFYNIRSAGTCVMTGGTLKDAGNCLVYSSGDFRVDYQGKNADDRLEWYNAAGEAGIRIGGSSTAYIRGVYVHDTVGSGISVLNHNKVEIENCMIENTGSYGFQTWNSHEDAVLTNLIIRNTAASAVRNHGSNSAQLVIQNLTVTDTDGFGIKNELGTVSARNVTVKSGAISGIWGAAGSVTVVDGAVVTGMKRYGLENNSGTMTFKNVEVSDVLSGVVMKKESVTELSNVTIKNPTERGVYNLGGTVTAENITVVSAGTYGVVSGASAGFHGQMSVTNLTVAGAKENSGLFCYDSVLSVVNASVSGVGEHGALTQKNGQLTLADVEIKDCGKRGICSMGGIASIKNVTVTNPGDYGMTSSLTVADDKKSYVGEITAENLTVTGVKGNALNSNGGIIKITKGKISDVGSNGAYIENGGQLTLADVEMKDCGKRGIFVRSQGTKVVLADTKISGTENSGVFLEPGVEAEAQGLTLSDSKSYGLYVKSGTFKGSDVKVTDVAETGVYITSTAEDGKAVVSIEGLTVEKPGERGVSNAGGDVTLKNVNVTDPGTYGVTSSRSGDYTGQLTVTGLTVIGVQNRNGLNCNGSVINVTEGTISDITGYGACIENGGQLTLTEVDIRDTGKRGIYVKGDAAKATVTDTKISNTGESSIFAEEGAVVNAQNVTITASKSYSIYVNGSGSEVTINGDSSGITGITETSLSAIYVKQGALTINGGSYSGHTVEHGGIIYNEKGNVTINGGVFKDNAASGRGGVIYCTTSSKTTITGGEFTNNIAESIYGGGAISCTGGSELVVTGGYFHDNTAACTDSKAYGGGAIESNGTVTIQGGTFEANTAFKGGAVYIDKAGTLAVSGGEFLGNATFALADTAGGAIFNRGDNLAITGGVFGSEEKGNISYHRGGALYLDCVDGQNRSATIKDAVFIGNNVSAARSVSAGALYVQTGVNAAIENCRFEKNQTVFTGTSTTTYSYGGAVYVNSSTVAVTGSVFTGNTASMGGAILITGDNGSLTLKECEFSDNTAKTSGTDVRFNGKSKFHLAGKVKSEIALADTAAGYADEALTEGSAITIRIINTSTINNRVVVTFKDDAVMNDSKSYFSLYDTHKNYRLSFNNSKAAIVKASLASGNRMRLEIV